MKWKGLFDSSALEDGLLIYRNGLGSFASQLRDSSWGVTVHADKKDSFYVTVELDEQGNVRSMSCGCGESGRPCGHMAAACFVIQDALAPTDGAGGAQDPGEEENDILASVPFERLAGSPEYHYFDLNYMTRYLPLTRSLCGEGRRLWEQGAVSLDDVRLDYPNWYEGTILHGSTRAEVRDGEKTYKTYISFNKSFVSHLSCDCSAHFSTPKDDKTGQSGAGTLCRHGAALLFALEDHILCVNPGDATDGNTTRMLEIMGKVPGGHTEKRDRPVFHLEPQLEGHRENLAVTFRAGTTTMYKLRDLWEFVRKFDSGASMAFGKATVIDYSECVMDDFSLRCYQFIKDVMKEEEDRGKFNLTGVVEGWSMSSAAIKVGIALIGWRLDAFYDLVNDRQCGHVRQSPVGYVFPGTPVTCRDARPAAKVTVEKLTDERDRFEGVTVTGQVPMLAEGLSYYYRLAEGGCLERIPKESMRELLPLCRIADWNGQISLTLGRGHLGWLYHALLPGLRKCGSALITERDPDLIAEYVPPEPEFKFYLDAGDGGLSCRVLAVYGESEVNISDLLSGGADTIPFWRDADREKEIVRLAMKYFSEYDEEEGILRCGQDEDAVFRVLSAGVAELMDLGEVNGTPQFLRLKIRPVPRITVGVSLDSGILELDISSEDLTREELLDILDGYRQKKRYIRLKNGDFLRTDGGEDRVEALADMMDALRVTPRQFVKGKMQFPAYRALYLDRMLEESSDIYAKRDSHFRQLVKEFKTVPDSDFEVPESLAPVLRGYQEEGYKWLRTLEAYNFGGILADDMGLGKTLQMISVFLAWKEEGKHDLSLVVCPASLVYNWGEELERFAPRLKVALVAGAQKEREEMLADHARYDVLVTSYDLLKRDIDQYEDISFLGQVLDEAQSIKNQTTAAAKAVKLIKSRYRFALTGTPIENKLSELWSIFDFLMPGFLYSYSNFRKEIEAPVVRKGDQEAAERLRRMVSPFILRRLRKDVLKDLPEKLEEVVYARAGTEQQRLCDGQAAHIQELLASQDEEAFSRGKIKTLAELTRLREICCDPSLLYEDYDGGSAKREACLELIDQAMEGGHRMLIFSQFTSMLALLEEDLRENGIAYYKIIGATPKQERVELVRDFNEGDTPVFLISLKAGGTGLNLTGADVVIHYDPWWNMAAEDQATGRAHRIGQTRVVTEYKLILKDSVEERILKMQEAKSGLADEILSGEETGGLGSLSREDLLELLGV